MSKEILLRNEKDKEEKGYIGFSWLLLFFGPLILLIRKDLKGIFINIFLHSILIFILAGTITVDIQIPSDMYLYAFLYGQRHIDNYIYGYKLGTFLRSGYNLPLTLCFNLVFAFLYNKYYTKNLVKKGFRPIDEEGEKLLKKYKINY